MSASSARNRTLNAVLALAALALAAGLAAEWQQGQALRARLENLRHDTATPPPLSTLQPFTLAPLPSYAQIVDRPLFTASRKPPAQEAATVAPPPQLALTGIAQDKGDAVVLVRDLKTGKTERIKSGSTSPDGLQIGEIKDNGVVLRQGKTDIPLELNVALSAGQRATNVAPGPNTAPSPAVAASSAVQAKAAVSASGAPAGMDAGLRELNAQRAKQGLPPLH